MNSPLVLSTLLILLASVDCACAGDWMTWRSTYTHDPVTGLRVEQYAAPVEPLAPDQGNLVRSGYRHYRSTIQAGESADNLHIVHEWGRPVMPYEHWRFPYRPYGVPYGAWGPPTPSVYSNFQYGNFAHPGRPQGGFYGPPSPQPGFPNGSAAGAAAAGGLGFGSGYGGGYSGSPGGYANGYGSGSFAYPLVPPFQPAPWYDGMHPQAPPLDSQSDPRFFYRPPQSR